MTCARATVEFDPVLIRPLTVVSQLVEKEERTHHHHDSYAGPSDLEDVQDVPQVSEFFCSSYTTLQIRKRVDKKKGSSLRSLLMVETALLVLVLVSRTVWMRQFWSKDELEGSIQQVEMLPEEFGHGVGWSI